MITLNFLSEKSDSFYRKMWICLVGLSVVGTSAAAASAPREPDLSGGIEQQQDRTVRGVVVNKNGETLPGVSVLVKGTQTGVTTDMDGRFTLQVPAGSKTLQFSFIGMQTREAAASAKGELRIVLEDDMVALDEVVAIGYGSVSKKDLTGSVVNISDKTFNKGVVTSAEQLIAGQVAGLVVTKAGGDPTEGSTMRLRGTTSLLGGNAPLVVIDGVPGASMNIVAPQDIESISVLKDASAAAIYGARSANGVIIITTKKGKEGRASVSYDGYFGVEQIANNLDMLSADEWRQYVKENKLDAVDYGGNTAWHKEIFRTGYSQNHNLSLTGGSKETHYRASVNFLDQKGIVLKNDLQRINASFSLEQSALDNKLTVRMNANTTLEKWHDIPDKTVYTYSYNLNPTIPIYDEEGKYKEVLGHAYYNPIAVLNQLTSEKKRNYFQGRLQADYKIIPSLTASVNGSVSRDNYLDGFYAPRSSKPGEAEKGRAKRSTSENTSNLLEANLTYDETFGLHKVNAIVGYSYQDFSAESFSAQNRNFSTDLFSYNNLGAGNKLQPDDVKSNKESNRLISFYGRATYSFNNKYTATATVRRDGSSRFGKNNRWGIFPSGSLAWRLSEEAFMDNLSFVDDLKLRVSYGITGNQDIPNYRTMALYGTYGYYFSNGEFFTQYAPSQNPNPDLKWEQTAQLNVGLDYYLWGGKLRGSIEYYNKQTSNLLYDYPVPSPPYQFGNMIANVGKVSNKGIEIVIESTPIRNKNFTWDVSFNFSKNKNMVESLSNEEFQREEVYTGAASISGLQETSQILKAGYPLGTFFGAKYIGQDENGIFQYADISKDGNFVYADDRTDIGCAQPDFTINLTNSFEYKNFTLSFLLRGVFGNDVLNGSALYLNDISRMPGNNVLTSALGIAKQKLVYSSYYIEDGSFVRLDNLQVGYNFKLGDKSKVKKLRVYLTGNNLFVITKYKGIDPEVPQDGIVFGIDAQNYYPKTRSFTAGVNISF